MEKMQKFTTLNIDKLKQKNTKVVSAGDALKDIIPIEWSSGVKNGERKVIVEPKR